MANYVTDLGVSLNRPQEEALAAQGFRKIISDLNKGAGGNSIHLWFKKENGAVPITKVQATFYVGMADGLGSAGYTKIDKDLNAGAGGNEIYLWYLRGSGEYDTPIVEIDVTTNTATEDMKFKQGWERLPCNMNRLASGDWIHIWVKREKQTYICDVIATDCYDLDADYFKDGWIRLDEETNRGVTGAFVFIWVRQTTDSKRAVTELNVSTNDNQYEALQQQQYTPVTVNLNRGNSGDAVYMWFKKQGGKPMKGVTLLVNQDAFQEYKKAGVKVIDRDLNSGNLGRQLLLCFSE